MVFCFYGGSVEVHKDEFYNEMNDYRKFRGDEIVSRQAIHFWVHKGNRPTRLTAFSFLKNFISERFKYEKKSGDQIKVFNQIVEFLDKAIVSAESNPDYKKPNLGIHASGKCNLSFINNTEDNEISDYIDSWQGIYISYRMRLIRNEDNPISREVVRISRRQKDIQYQHWHLREGVSLDRFEGYVTLKAETAWCFGASLDNKRYRICHFKNNNSINPVQRKLRWGLMHSDIPTSSSREPASTRIILSLYENKVENFQSFLEENVKYISLQELDDSLKEIVDRATNNIISSESVGGGIEPSNIEESVLHVDQKTLENLCNKLESLR